MDLIRRILVPVDFSPGSDVPQPYGVVVAPHRQQLAIGRKGHGPEILDLTDKSGDRLPGRQIPHGDRLPEAADGEHPAIGPECQVIDGLTRAW